MRVDEHTAAIKKQVAAQMIQKGLMFLMIAATQKYAKDNAALAGVFGALTGTLIGLTIAWNAWEQIKQYGAYGVIAIAATTAALLAIFNYATTAAMQSTDDDRLNLEGKLSTGDEYTMGGRVYTRTGYATGGRIGGSDGNHFPVMVEGGETIIPKTQNMLTGSTSGGITINISGDVYDGDNFADKISEALPSALRISADRGGIIGR
jgi:hypothetical protein